MMTQFNMIRGGTLVETNNWIQEISYNFASYAFYNPGISFYHRYLIITKHYKT